MTQDVVNYAPIYEGAIKVFREKGIPDLIAKQQALLVVDSASEIATATLEKIQSVKSS